jgi:hypothetical protein
MCDKKSFKFGILVLIALLYLFTSYPKLDLISGFSAKSIASGHFIDNRSIEMIEVETMILICLT